MDFLIIGGEIFDPSAKTTKHGDITIVNGKIACPESGKTYR